VTPQAALTSRLTGRGPPIEKPTIHALSRRPLAEPCDAALRHSRAASRRAPSLLGVRHVRRIGPPLVLGKVASRLRRGACIGCASMGAALVRIVKRVPSVAVGGLITAVTVLASGELNQAVPTALGEINLSARPGEQRVRGEKPARSSLLESSRAQLPPSGEGYGSTEPIPECSSVYPNLRVCSQLPHRYMYGSQQEALADLKSETSNAGLRIQTPRPATGGPCPGVGQHYNVREARSSRDYPASIVCCPCCDDDLLGAPTEDRLCGIVPKNSGCDTRRRASDASCEE
jgi:hypothetical protein